MACECVSRHGGVHVWLFLGVVCASWMAVSCVPSGWHAMAETESSWSSGVHGTNLHGRSRIVRMSKWLTVLLRGSCESWREGWHGGELHGLYVAPALLCIQLPSPVNM
jgi:hypothetical protein